MPETDPKANRHVRLVIETDGRQTTVLQRAIIQEPLPPPTRVVGPIAYEVFVGGKLVWLDTVPDPFTHRGISRRGEEEHSFGTKQKGDLVVKFPQSGDQIPADVRIRILRLGSERVPRLPSELERMLLNESLPETRVIADVQLQSISPDI